jgi:carbon storage regulator
MLVLGRKVGERIVLPGCGVTVTVVAVRGNQVRLGVSAPAQVEVHREEVWRLLSGAQEGTAGTAQSRAP